jgi:hypothetical protein
LRLWEARNDLIGAGAPRRVEVDPRLNVNPLEGYFHQELDDSGRSFFGSGSVDIQHNPGRPT